MKFILPVLVTLFAFAFPADDESAAKLAKLMANAAKWKAAKAAKEAENGS